MKNKKGFTLVELLSAIVILGIIITIAVLSVSGYFVSSKQSAYSDHEKNMKSAAANYLIINSHETPDYGNSLKITLQTLVKGDYLHDLKDPADSNENCNYTKSYVEVTRDDTLDNIKLNYKVCLVCSEYKTKGCD